MTVFGDFEFLSCYTQDLKAGAADAGCKGPRCPCKGRRGRAAAVRSRSARNCRQRTQKRRSTPEVRGSVSAPVAAASRTAPECSAPPAKVAARARAPAPRRNTNPVAAAIEAAAPAAGAAAQAEVAASAAASGLPQDVAIGKVDDAVVSGLGRVLEKRMLLQKEGDVSETKMFHSAGKTAMSVSNYVVRLRKYMACSTECFVIAMVYLDRVAELKPGILASSSALRLLLTSMMLAAKFNDDTFYANRYYAQVGGVTLKELNSLEVTLLQFLEWNVRVTPEEFEKYRAELRRAGDKPVD